MQGKASEGCPVTTKRGMIPAIRSRRMTAAISHALVLAIAVAAPRTVAARDLGPLPGSSGSPPASGPSVAEFQQETASDATRRVADWVTSSGDNHGLPFVIVDKVNAAVFVFDGHAQLRGASRALVGLARGDDSVPGIGERKMSSIRPEERTTPAGRFVASLGHDTGNQDILWVDYVNAVSLHRVVTSNPKERRLQRLATASPLDRRISYGCINVPARFYDAVVLPEFTHTKGLVYILPETRSLRTVFPGLSG